MWIESVQSSELWTNRFLNYYTWAGSHVYMYTRAHTHTHICTRNRALLCTEHDRTKWWRRKTEMAPEVGPDIWVTRMNGGDSVLYGSWRQDGNLPGGRKRITGKFWDDQKTELWGKSMREGSWTSQRECVLPTGACLGGLVVCGNMLHPANNTG